MRVRTVLLGAIAAVVFATSAFAFWHGQSNNCLAYQTGLCLLYNTGNANIILIQ